MKQLFRAALRPLVGLALFALLGFPHDGDASPSATFQYPTQGWQAYAPTRIECGDLFGANMNSTADQAINISMPTLNYLVDSIEIDEFGQTAVSLTTAEGGFYTAAGKTGVTLVANTQVYSTITGNTANTTGNAMLATLATAANTTALQYSTIYFSLTTAQGAAALANIRVYCRPLLGPQQPG